jgi:hypothetical protein
VFKGSRKEIDDYEEEVEDEPATKDTDKDGYNEKELKYYRADEDFGDPEEKIEIIKRHQP